MVKTTAGMFGYSLETVILCTKHDKRVTKEKHNGHLRALKLASKAAEAVCHGNKNSKKKADQTHQITSDEALIDVNVGHDGELHSIPCCLHRDVIAKNGVQILQLLGKLAVFNKHHNDGEEYREVEFMSDETRRGGEECVCV